MIENKPNKLTKPIAITLKAYEIAKSESETRKAAGYSSSVTAIASEAIVAQVGAPRD